ncbi:MAG: methyltransferase domain-containing protein [Candidatus Kapabacteria bacterium]|nr:methyltransferase domain-containing protein [Candidatus Kapabacteria bacterium]
MSKVKQAFEVFDERANSYQEKYMDVSMYADSLDLFCNLISKPNAEILELACGPGNITKYLLNKRSDYKILSTDLSPNMLELASANNPNTEFQLMDCRDIGSIQKKYDGIVCGFCLPYLSKDETLILITNSSKVLKSNGLIYLSTMEDDYSKSGIQTSSFGDKCMMYYHQADYLVNQLEKSDFEVISLTRKNNSNANGTKEIDLIIKKKKKLPFFR